MKNIPGGQGKQIQVFNQRIIGIVPDGTIYPVSNAPDVFYPIVMFQSIKEFAGSIFTFSAHDKVCRQLFNRFAVQKSGVGTAEYYRNSFIPDLLSKA